MALKTDYRWYLSLEKARRQLKVAKTDENDQLLRDWIEVASAFIESYTERIYIPKTATKYFDVPRTGKQNVEMHDDLLTLTTLSDDNGTITSSYYFLYPLNSKPKRRIELLRSSRFFYFSDTRQRAISVAGTWGVTDDYENTGVTLDGAVNTATETRIVVSEGVDIEVGWCLLVDTEQMFVRDVDGTTVTVWRGANGTTAAAQDDAAVVYRYVPPADVEGAVLLLVSFWYNMREQPGVQSERLEDFSVTYRGKPISDEAMVKIDNYKMYDYLSYQEQYP